MPYYPICFHRVILYFNSSKAHIQCHHTYKGKTGHASPQFCRKTGSIDYKAGKNTKFTECSKENPQSASLFASVTAVCSCNCIDFKGVTSSFLLFVCLFLPFHDRMISYSCVWDKCNRDLGAELFIISVCYFKEEIINLQALSPGTWCKLLNCTTTDDWASQGALLFFPQGHQQGDNADLAQ